MGVDRSISLRIASKYTDTFDLVNDIVKTGLLHFNKDGSISTLRADDIDDYDLVSFTEHDAVREIFVKREISNLANYILIWDENYEDSFYLRINKLENEYQEFRSHINIDIYIGSGKRVENADRYTDYGYYLKLFLPIFLKFENYICEINCKDFDC